MKVTITSSVSSKLIAQRVEIDDEFCKRYNTLIFKEGTVEVETPDAYMIRPKIGNVPGIWFPKDMISVLPEHKTNLSRWV